MKSLQRIGNQEQARTDAALFTARVSTESVLSAEARGKRPLLERVHDSVRWTEELLQDEPHAWYANLEDFSRGERKLSLALTANDFGEEEKVHGLVNGARTVLVRVVVLSWLIRGRETGCLGRRGAYGRRLEVVARFVAHGWVELLVTRSGRMPTVGKRERTRSSNAASGQPGGGTGGD